MGKDGYQRLAQVSAATGTTLVPRWDRDWVKLHEAADCLDAVRNPIAPTQNSVPLEFPS